MYQASLFSIARAALIATLLSGFGFQFSALAVQSATLIWDPSTAPDVAGYKIYYGTISHNYTNIITLGNVTNATVTGLNEGTTYFFAATSYDTSGVESDFSNEASYAVPVIQTNQPPIFQPPTLNSINNISVNENAALQTINLSGISLGTINLSLSPVAAVSSNPALIPTPAVNYTIPNTAGTLTFTPVHGATGTATITVTVNNGQPQSNIVSRSFTVTVKPVAQPPTLDPISNLTIIKNSASQIVNLSGITSGATNQNQKIKITAASSGRSLISMTVNYASPNTTGTLTLKPVKNATGTTTVTVTVNNGSKSNNIVTQKFTVTIVAQNPTNSPAPPVVTTQPTNDPSPPVPKVSKGRGSTASSNVLPAVAGTLTSAACAKGQFTFDVSGTSDALYIVQASTNLVDWESVQTNTAPFTFTDTDASKYSRRFYRAIPQSQ
jgi:Fibronectin type III domain